MADSKLTALTENTAPASNDLVYIVDDPSGTPVSQKVTILNLLGMSFASEISITGTITATLGRMHVCSGTTSDYTVTLPAASGKAGKKIGFRMDPALTKFVTLDGNSSETIDGALTRVMWANEAAILLCDGSNWFKISGKTIPMQAIMHQAAVKSLSDTTVTTADLDTTDVDNTGAMADATNKRINIKRTSVYFITGISVISSSTGASGISANSSRTITQIQKNGSQIAFTEGFGATGGFPSIPCPSASSLALGDNVKLGAYQQSGVTQGIYGTANLSDGASQLQVTENPSW